MRNIKVTLEYDGTDFSGWQIQPHQRTVQGVLQDALAELLQKEVKLTGAGRTDAGVHALNQIATFRTETHLGTEEIKNGANSLLPPDLSVKRAEEAPSSFNARRDAVARTYRYRIVPTRSPTRRRYAWELKYSLNLSRMRKASRSLLGVHDFTSFSSGSSPNKTVKVSTCEWKRRGDEIVMDIEADHFLHNMVRVLVGTLVDVGRGRLSVEDLSQILEARDRTLAGPTAPPQGLCLVDVEY